MGSTFRLLTDGSPADDKLYTVMGTLEVEENADLPGAVQLNLPVDTTDSQDLTFVTDDRFRPFANLAVVVTPTGQSDQCVFDGYVLTHKLRLKKGTSGSARGLGAGCLVADEPGRKNQRVGGCNGRRCGQLHLRRLRNQSCSR